MHVRSTKTNENSIFFGSERVETPRVEGVQGSFSTFCFSPKTRQKPRKQPGGLSKAEYLGRPGNSNLQPRDGAHY
jgi:hypothetical protein